MGKKGSWFSAIKKVFSSSSKEKPTDVSVSFLKIIMFQSSCEHGHTADLPFLVFPVRRGKARCA